MKTKIKFESSKKVIERVSRPITEMEENGNVNVRVRYEDVDVSSDDYVKDLPRLEEYTLSNLMSAGIPLEQLNVSGLMSGNLDTMLNQIDYGQELLDRLVAKENKEEK